MPMAVVYSFWDSFFGILACFTRHAEIEAAENDIIVLGWVIDCLKHGEKDKLVAKVMKKLKE